LTQSRILYSFPVIALKYLRYLLTASNGSGHGIHSPFLYAFTRQVLDDRIRPQACQPIEALRAHLHLDRRMLDIDDFGAGSVSGRSRHRRVGQVARSAAKPSRYGRLLHRVAAHLGCRHALELGTSLGLSTAYLATVPGMEKVLSLEGSPSVRQVASENMVSLKLFNVTLLEGNFDQTLGQALQQMPRPDLVFFDGNHRYEPTMRYFQQCLPYASEDAVFIFDDIHWSREMEQAWAVIRQHPQVRCSIDLFFLGFVFFRSAFRQPQQVAIRYTGF